MKEFIDPQQVLQRQDNLDQIMRPLLENNPQAHRHSLMVAGSVSYLAEIYSQNPEHNFADIACDKAYVSALLHDLGKGNLAWVTMFQGRPASSNTDFLMQADHALQGSLQLKTLEDKGVLNEELLEVSRFIAKNHHTPERYKQTSHLANTRALFKDPAVRREYPRIGNWDELYDILMMVKISDALDSCTNNMPGKIPISQPGYIRSLSVAVPHIRLQFEGQAAHVTKERFDKKFLNAYDLLGEQMLQYEHLMKGMLV